MDNAPARYADAPSFATDDRGDPFRGRPMAGVASFRCAGRVDPRPLHRRDDYCLRANVSCA